MKTKFISCDSMSRIRKFVELDHPSHMGRPGKELLVSAGQRCNYCHGNGWFWGTDDSHESVKTPCPMCDGRGEVDAVVTVEWKSKGNHLNIR